mgnify:CR=1 FL=1
MAKTHQVTDDVVYDVVSIQYHALQALSSYERYLDDAHSADHDDVTEFVRQCRDQDQERARRCHELLGDLTVGSTSAA